MSTLYADEDGRRVRRHSWREIARTPRLWPYLPLWLIVAPVVIADWLKRRLP